MTRAGGADGVIISSSTAATNDTRLSISFGAFTFTVAPSRDTAVPAPKAALIARARLVELEKSGVFRLSIKDAAVSKGLLTIRSTVAPPGMRPTVGMLTVRLDPSLPVIPRPPTARLPCAMA